MLKAAVVLLSFAAAALAAPPTITGVVNGASFQPGVASSAWISIFGAGLSRTTRDWNGAITGSDLPTVLDGVSVKIGGKPAYIAYISAGQVNALVPDGVAEGEVSVQLKNADGESNTYTVTKTGFAPAFFKFSETYVAALHASNAPAGKVGLAAGVNFTPAQPGETLMLFGTGFGPTDPALPTGKLVTSAAPLTNQVTVTIGGKPAAVTYAGVTMAGLDQINVTIPPDLPEGDAVVVAECGGVTTPAVSITIGGAWRLLGPGGGGAMFRPVTSPHDPNLTVLASDMTGAFITRDGGASWREFNLRTVVSAVAFDPVNPDVIYAGSDGVFRSDDRGATWRLIFPDPATAREEMVGDHADHSFYSTDPTWPGGGAQVQAIRVDPDDAGRVYAVIASWSNSPQLYYWFENAWHRSAAALGTQPVLNLFVDTSSKLESRRVIAVSETNIYSADVMGASVRSLTVPAAGIRDATGANGVLYVTTASGVFKSTNGGESWQAIQSLKSFAPTYTKISAAEKNPQIVYIGADPFGSGESEWGILKSTDGGETWNWVHHVQEWRDPANKVLGWLDRDLPGWGGPPQFGLSTDATGQVCYATDYGTAYRTLDGGATWAAVYSNELPDGTSMSRGLDVTTTYGVHFDPFNKDHIVVSYTDIGLFHSLNGGLGWKRIVNGVPRAWTNTSYWVAFDPEVKNRAWSVWGGAHDLPRPKMFKTSLARYYVGGVCRTNDAAMNWSCRGDMDMGAVTHIIVDPKSPAESRTLYIASFGDAGLGSPSKPGGVYKSTDAGAHWTLKTTGMTGTNRNGWHLTQAADGTLYVLIARGLDPRTNTEIPGAIYKSTDGAEHWTPVPMPANANAPNDLVIDPTNPKRMYLACWPRVVNGKNLGGGLFVTGDGGANWSLLFDQSPHVYGVALDPDDPSTIFINTFNGAAYKSADSGATWRRLKGYDFKWGHRPVPDPVNKGKLYLTTFGSSVWHGPAEVEGN
ncbi:MAG: IPT/TIG domain-containing protein [Acidobacteriota bacterium]